MWFVCVALAIPATVFLLCWCGLSGQDWVAMVFKRSEGVRGFQEERGLRKCWRMPSRLMAGRNGFPNSVRSHMCGRGGVEGDAGRAAGKVPAGSGSKDWRMVNGSVTSNGEENRNSKSQEAEIEELRAPIEHYRKAERGRSSGRARPSTQKRKWHGGRMRSRKKLDEQRKSCRKCCGTLENSRVCRKRFRTTSRMTCSISCRRWSKGGMTSYQSIRECRKDHKRYKTSRIQEGICRKKVLQQKRRCGRSERKSIKEERFLLLSDKVDKNRMADAEMEAELQGL